MTTDAPSKKHDKIEDLVREMLIQLGEDPSREGLQKTPSRVAESLRFLTKGHSEDVHALFNGAVFQEKYSEMVIVKDIDFFSLCEHHVLPFYGKIHVAYIPKGRILGLSKIPRLVDMFSRRLQVQERMTQEIAQSLFDALRPLGVGVVCEARHLCMMMRGVEKQGSSATTSAMLGDFRTDLKTRSEFLTLIGLTSA